MCQPAQPSAHGARLENTVAYTFAHIPRVIAIRWDILKVSGTVIKRIRNNRLDLISALY